MGFEETLDVGLLLPRVGSSEPPVIRVWTGGPARIRLKTTANPSSRSETLADSRKFGGFLDAAPYRYMLKLVFDEFACSEVQNRWDSAPAGNQSVWQNLFFQHDLKLRVF